MCKDLCFSHLTLQFSVLLPYKKKTKKHWNPSKPLSQPQLYFEIFSAFKSMIWSVRTERKVNIKPLRVVCMRQNTSKSKQNYFCPCCFWYLFIFIFVFSPSLRVTSQLTQKEETASFRGRDKSTSASSSNTTTPAMTNTTRTPTDRYIQAHPAPHAPTLMCDEQFLLQLASLLVCVHVCETVWVSTGLGTTDRMSGTSSAPPPIPHTFSVPSVCSHMCSSDSLGHSGSVHRASGSFLNKHCSVNI